MRPSGQASYADPYQGVPTVKAPDSEERGPFASCQGIRLRYLDAQKEYQHGKT